MRAFMTTGTTAFLKQLTNDRKENTFYFMKSGMATLVYYEANKKKSIFVSGKTYEVLQQFGTINKTGFVVMNHIPIMEEEMSVFADRTKKQLEQKKHMHGIQAVRLLKEIKSNQFIIFTQWDNEKNYKEWQKTLEEKGHSFSQMARVPAYFADRPFTNSYYMLIDEEDESE